MDLCHLDTAAPVRLQLVLSCSCYSYCDDTCHYACDGDCDATATAATTATSTNHNTDGSFAALLHVQYTAAVDLSACVFVHSAQVGYGFVHSLI